MEYIRKILIIAETLVVIAVLVGVLFSPDIRGNFVSLVSTLLDEGLVGYIVIIFLLYLYYPVYKFFRAFLKIRSLKEALDKSIVKTKIDIWLDRIVFGIVPVIYIIFIVFIK